MPQRLSHNYHRLLKHRQNKINLTQGLRKQSTKADSLLLKQIAYDFLIDTNLNVAKLDFDKLSFPLRLRKWKNGDKFKPLGMHNFKKLSDFFIDEKYSLLDKQKQWILCSENDIIWIVGTRIDDRYKIDTQTKKVYIAELLK